MNKECKDCGHEHIKTNRWRNVRVCQFSRRAEPISHLHSNSFGQNGTNSYCECEAITDLKQ